MGAVHPLVLVRRDVRLASAAAAACLALVAAGCGGAAHEQQRASSGAATASVPVEFAPPGARSETARRLRAVFTSERGETYRVFETRRTSGETCVVSSGGGFSTSACSAAPFAGSRALFVESASGGPAATARTEFQVTGLLDVDVTRAQVVDSRGRVWPVKVESGAFFFELPRAALGAGVGAVALRLFDAQDRLLERVDL